MILGTSDVWRWHTSDGRPGHDAEAERFPQYGELRERAVVVDIDGTEVAVAGLDDLIAMKRTTGRPRDLLKLIELEDLKAVQSEPADHRSD